MALGLRQVLWGDGDLAEDEALAREVEAGREKLLLEIPNVVAPGNRDNVKAALELAEAVAKAETDRETNLNTRGGTVAAVAGVIVPVATAVAKTVFATPSNWTGFTRNVMEWFFLAALVFVASAMVMAVVGVLRPTRGGRTKNAVGEAVVNVWRQERGDIALAAGAARQIEVFRLDRLLRAIPSWHYRNRSKARWLRRRLDVSDARDHSHRVSRRNHPRRTASARRGREGQSGSAGDHLERDRSRHRARTYRGLALAQVRSCLRSTPRVETRRRAKRARAGQDRSGEDRGPPCSFEEQRRWWASLLLRRS
jgi:hypothetical protein